MPLGILHHEVNVQRKTGPLGERLAEIEAEGEIGHVAAIHDVHVQVIRASRMEGAQVIRKMKEVRAHHRGRDADSAHAHAAFSP